MHIKDSNNSRHGKFHRFLFPFSSKFPDLNFAPYVLFIYSCHVKPVRDTNSEPGLPVFWINMRGNPRMHPDVRTGWRQLRTPKRCVEIIRNSSFCLAVRSTYEARQIYKPREVRRLLLLGNCQLTIRNNMVSKQNLPTHDKLMTSKCFYLF